jgi:hypothetical protein
VGFLRAAELLLARIGGADARQRETRALRTEGSDGRTAEERLKVGAKGNSGVAAEIYRPNKQLDTVVPTNNNGAA